MHELAHYVNKDAPVGILVHIVSQGELFLGKLNLTNRTQAALYALREGIARLDIK